MTGRHSVSYRTEPQQVSSREQLAEMAASSQGKDGRARRRRRRGEPPPGAAEGGGLRARQARQRSPGSPRGAGAGRAAGARPWPSGSQGPAKVRRLAGAELPPVLCPALAQPSGAAPPAEARRHSVPVLGSALALRDYGGGVVPLDVHPEHPAGVSLCAKRPAPARSMVSKGFQRLVHWDGTLK